MVNGSERPENERMDIGYNEALNDIKQRLVEMPSADVQPVNQWISVKDRLPDIEEGEVLVWIKEGEADGMGIFDCCHIGYWVKASKEFCDMDWDVINGITHWMPLPEPPKDGDTK